MSDMANSNNLIESRIKYINERKIKHRAKGPYTPKSYDDVTQGLTRFFESQGHSDILIGDLERMTGGASKEQFAFTLQHSAILEQQRFVLRMDPLEGIVETCRLREAEILIALDGVIPVPGVLAVDAEGDYLGQPGIITHFVKGVTKPTDMDGASVSGIGSTYGEYTEKLVPEFIKYLSIIHSLDDWSGKSLDTYDMPAPNTKEAALFQVNWWSDVWKMDEIEAVPMVKLTENWLRKNAPVCEKPCLIHADYRLGNFMFEEPSGKFTTILDWELAHFGDFHEDIAWILQKLFGGWTQDGEFLVCSLMTRERFLREYQAASGRVINDDTLRYYEVLNAWKCAVMDLSSAVMAGENSNNHQDLLITWLASAGAVFLNQLVELIGEA